MKSKNGVGLISLSNSNAPGPIKLTTELSINTQQAKLLVIGREPKGGKNIIMGLRGFSKLVNGIYTSAKLDDPFADLTLFKIETIMDEGKAFINSRIDYYRRQIEQNSCQKIFESVNPKPWKIRLGFSHPYGYKLADLILAYDNLMCTMLTGRHIGLLENKALMTKDSGRAKKYVRSITGLAMHWKNYNVTRRDVNESSAIAKNALSFYQHHYSNKQIFDVISRVVLPKYGPLTLADRRSDGKINLPHILA